MATAIASPAPEPVRWSFAHRVAFRLVFCYVLLYYLGKPLSYALSIAPWIAVHVVHLSGERTTYFATGSGDTTLSYIEAGFNLLLTLAVTFIWSIADRRRPNYRTMHAWLRVFIRYLLAATLLGYGFAKVIPSQFPVPTVAKLQEPLGQFSPMAVLWTFMGVSTPYQIFAGAMEVLAGALLLFRRTTTLGSLVAVGVLTNIVMLNLCYDVPVKLNSLTFLFFAMALATPDAQRLWSVLVLNRPVVAADPMAIHFERRWLRTASWVIWGLWVSASFVGLPYMSWAAYQQRKVLHKVEDAQSYPLFQRGFHWIQERPYQR